MMLFSFFSALLSHFLLFLRATLPQARFLGLGLFLLLFALVSCKDNKRPPSSMGAAFAKTQKNKGGHYDLDEIQRSGELLVGTLSGPESYYEYHGVSLGLQYGLAENFANSLGLSLRMEIASDTATLLQWLREGKIDVLAYPIASVDDKALSSAGAVFAEGRQTWWVKTNAPVLAAALNEWYAPERPKTIAQAQALRLQQGRQVRRRPQAVYLSRSRGIISVYDDLFKRASLRTGWDWRLMAAQCYQESAFDPNAQSWAGAQGLMQIMPQTAQGLGASPEQIRNPESNIDFAAQYIAQLSRQFADIRDHNERIKFVLAAYNGGPGHLRDAMALARKYGKNPQSWDDVSAFVLGLQNARYYRDPVVRYGYMIGSETANYVYSVLERWRAYGGVVLHNPSPKMPTSFATESQPSPSESPTTSKGKMPAPPSYKTKNKYSSGMEILSPDDPRFHQMQNP